MRNVIEGKLFEFVQLYVAKRRETITGKGESADTATANERLLLHKHLPGTLYRMPIQLRMQR